MTVKELIDLLNKYPLTMRVVVDGYEGGYDDIKKLGSRSLCVIPIFLNRNPPDDYSGEHELCYEDSVGEPDDIALAIGSRHHGEDVDGND